MGQVFILSDENLPRQHISFWKTADIGFEHGLNSISEDPKPSAPVAAAGAPEAKDPAKDLDSWIN